MKLGIMQPYFFPYIGYWQLINAVDEFILFDDVQFIRHGWINRNRVLKSGGWAYITLPLKKHSRDTKIREIEISNGINLKNYVLTRLTYYKNKSPFYDYTVDLIDQILSDIRETNLAAINEYIIAKVSKVLGIKTKISTSSKRGYDYSGVGDSGEWALEISKQMGASEYINPISGRDIFDKGKFNSNGIKITFISPKNIIYRQLGSSFEPWLSIIDVLMFNGARKTMDFLNEYELMEG